MAETIYPTFLETVTRYPNRTALMHKRQGRYFGITYAELKAEADAVATQAQNLGIDKRDVVGIFSYNRPEWAIADLAILKLGGIVVPIYHTLPSSFVKYIINDSKIKLLFVENFELLAIIDKIGREAPSLKNVVVFDHSGKEGDFIKFDILRKPRHEEINKETPFISSNGIATIVYTSGTTGEPRGVVLTHGNIISNALSVVNRFQLTSEDVIVSYLPLSHMFERTCGYYAILFAGGSIAYAESLSTVAEDVAKIRPTLLLAVPRVIEKAYEGAVKIVEGSSFIKRRLVSSAIKNLNTYANLKYKKMKIPFVLKMKCAIYDTFIASKFRKIAGGRLRVIASGGAPIDQKIAKALYVLGFNIIEGYGLTETSPIVCCNILNNNILGTVGKPLDGVEVKIGQNDEILVKGPNVMRRYLNKPEETTRVIDKDGWFHTGDQGRFDEHGNLIITGRIKEIIVTSYGKKIASAPIEARMTKSRYIAQVMLYGDKMKYIVALVVPDREYIEDYARERKISFDSYQALLDVDEIKELIEREIEGATADLPSYERIKGFALLSEGFTVENGMLTPTLKIRRSEIGKRYEGLIDAIYENLTHSQNLRDG